MASSEAVAPTLEIHDAIKSKLEFYRIQHKIPNIVFHGPAGSGKKTLVRDFIRAIYDGNPTALKSYVMYVNCAEGKGIRFIREDLKTFAKTNIIVPGAPTTHKTIVLLHADQLTNDAQSALRCCIENHSNHTRFFMIVQNKYNLLKPILSRLCEIHVPLPMIAINGAAGVDLRPVNLYKYRIDADTTAAANKAATKRIYLLRKNIQDRLAEWSTAAAAPAETTIMDFCRESYEHGYSALDFIHIIDICPAIVPDVVRRYDLLLEFHRIKTEIRHEPLLMYYILLWLLEKKTSTTGLA